MLALWLACLGIALGAKNNNAKIVKISGVFPVFNKEDGSVISSGAQEVAAFEMAVREINAGLYDDKYPSLKGITIHRSTTFLTSDFIDAVEKALEYNGWKSDGMIGSNTNGLCNAVAQVNNGYKQNQVAYGCTGSYLSYVGPYPYFFRTCSDDAYQGVALAKLLPVKFPEWKAVTVFSTTGNDLGYGSDMFQQFQGQAIQDGYLNIVSQHQFRSGLADLTGILDKAKSAGTRIFILFMKGDDAANLIYQGWKAGLFVPGTQLIGANQMIGPESLQSKFFPADAVANLADILKGALALRQTTLADHPTDEYLKWIARWRAQPRTVPTQQNNPTVPDYDNIARCNTTVDNTSHGNFIYKGTTRTSKTNGKNTTRCVGNIFSTFAEDGSDTAILAPFVYDSVLGMAKGLADSIAAGNTGAYGASTYYGGDTLGAVMAAEGFLYDGVTGPVHFRSGDSTGYGYGDRETGMSFELLNFHPTTYCFKDQSGGLESMGRWEADKPFVDCDPTADADCFYVFNTPDNSRPLDRPPPIINSFAGSAAIILYFLAALSIVLAVGFAIMIARTAHKRLVKSYQPMMLYMALFGFFLSAIRTILAGIPFTDSVCTADVWFGHASFMIVFSTLTMKTWRVHLVINSSGFRRIKVTTQQVVLATVFIIGLLFVYLAILTGVGKPGMAYVETDLGALRVQLYPKCRDEVPGIGIALYVIEALWIAQGARLCWATKDAPDAVNDSGPIATSMYVIIFVSVIVFLLVFLIQIDPQTAELIIGLGFALATLSAEMALFLPKAILLWKGAELDNKMQIIMPDGRTLAEHNNKAQIGDHKAAEASSKPVYEKDSLTLLGRNKDQNLIVCKEQIMRWQKLMMSIEQRQILGTGSGSGSSPQSQSRHSQSYAPQDTQDGDLETTSLTGARLAIEEGDEAAAAREP